MKKILLLLAVMAASFAASAQSGSAIDSTQLNAPIIIFESETIDFGTIEFKANGDREFKFKNTGKEPLVISNVIKGCGCTKVDWPKEPILPGQGGVIKFNYDTQRVGSFEKTITVVSNSIVTNKTLRFKGNVLPQKQEEQFPGGK